MRLRLGVTCILGISLLLTACADRAADKREGPGVIAPGAVATSTVAASSGSGWSESGPSAAGNGGSGSGSSGEGSVPGSGNAVSVAPAGPGGTNNPASAAEALARWASFPVSVSPRPVVLLGDAVQAPAAGFPSADTKLAFLGGAITMNTGLPAAPATSDGFAVTAPAAAFAQLKASGGSSTTSSASLQVTSVTLGHASFNTDRGPRLLPSWSFRFAGVTDPAEVLAVAPSALWGAVGSVAAGAETAPAWASNTASVGTEGRSVTVSFAAAPVGPPPCGTPADGYIATALESATAAVITVAATPTVQPPAAGGGVSVACPAIAQQRSVTVALKAPLGARVLLDSTGSPYSVQ